MNGRKKELVLMLLSSSSSFLLILIIYLKRHNRHRSAHEMSALANNKYLSANVVVCQLYYYLLHFVSHCALWRRAFLFVLKQIDARTQFMHFCSLPFSRCFASSLHRTSSTVLIHMVIAFDGFKLQLSSAQLSSRISPYSERLSVLIQ